MNRLRILRKKSGKLQREIAEYLGVNRTTYLKYENGDNEPDFATISKLADYFGVSVDYLLERTNAKTSTADKANEEQNTEHDLKVALFGGADEVTDEMWNEVKTFAAFVKQKYNKD